LLKWGDRPGSVGHRIRAMVVLFYAHPVRKKKKSRFSEAKGERASSRLYIPVHPLQKNNFGGGGTGKKKTAKKSTDGGSRQKNNGETKKNTP